MKTIRFKLLSHGVCLGLGVLLAASLHYSTSVDQPNDSNPHASEESEGNEAIPERPGRPMKSAISSRDGIAGRQSAAGDFRGAWSAIASRDLTVSQRLEMQIGVLREWAKVDMEGAMRAALETPWGGGEAKGGIGPLMVAFDAVFQERPMEAWDLLQSGKLGLGTELFRRQWIQSASKTEPVFVFSVAPQISHELRMFSIESAMKSAASDPELKDQMIRKLADLPDQPVFDNYIAIAFNSLPANEGNATEVRERLASATNERAKTILLHEFTSTLREAGAAIIHAQWSQLDPEMQKRAAVAFFNGPQGTKNAPAVLDMLMATDQWDRVRAAGDRLAEYSRNLQNTNELAEWGMKLPDRPEAEQLFRRTIDPLINRDNLRAREWIESLPDENPRKDRALFAYTQNAIYARNDEGLFIWAVERISDPEVKLAAQMSYDSWAKRRGLSGD